MINKSYLSSREIVSLLKLICKEKNLKYMSIGESTEGHEIPGVFVGEENGNKPIILIEAGCHPREKVAAAATIYAIGQFAKEKKDKILTKILQTVDLAIAPLLNPDGYLFSIETDENWRKNRNSTSINHCRGVDINRNFCHRWREGGGERIRDPCSPFYCGNEPFSESETCALRDFLQSFEPRVKMYLSIHSPDQSIVYPWAYDLTQPEDREQLEHLAWNVSDNIREKFYTEFDVGQSSFLMGQTAGTSLDWAKAVAKIKYCYGINLPGPQYGYNMPPELIPHFGNMLLEMIGTFVQPFISSKNEEHKCTKDKDAKTSKAGLKSKHSILQMQSIDELLDENIVKLNESETEHIRLKEKQTPLENHVQNERIEIPEGMKPDTALLSKMETNSIDEFFNHDKNKEVKTKLEISNKAKETEPLKEIGKDVATAIEQPTPTITQTLEEIFETKENTKKTIEPKENSLADHIFDIKKESEKPKEESHKENQTVVGKTLKPSQKSEENNTQVKTEEVKNKKKLQLKRDVIVIRDRPTNEAMRRKSQYITRDIKAGINMSKMKSRVEKQQAEPCKTMVKGQELSGKTKVEGQNEVWIKEALKKVSKKVGKKQKKSEKTAGSNKTWIKNAIKMVVKKDDTKGNKASKKAPEDL